MSTTAALTTQDQPSHAMSWFNPDKQRELIRQTIAKTATEEEFMAFMSISKHLGLDPFRHEIYLVPRWDKGLNRLVQVPQVGVAGLRVLADRTGTYAPGRAATFEYDDAGELLSATAYVKKLVAGEWHEVSETVYLEEFIQLDNKGNITAMWKQKKRFMLGKCAERATIARSHPSSVPPGLALEGDAEINLVDDARTDNTKGAIAAEQMTKPPAAKVLSYISSAHDVDKLHEINARIEAYEWSAAESKSFKDAFTKRYDQLMAKELEAEVAQ